MKRIFSALLAFFIASPALAECPDTSVFSKLPEKKQTEMRTAAHQQPFAKGLIWQVSKNDVTSYIVGTLHLSNPRHAETIARVQPLYDKVDTLVLEMTSEDEAAFLTTLTSNSALFMITEGPSLIDRLGEDTWNTLLPRIEEAGLPGFMAAKYQPWFLGLALAVPPCVLEEQRAGKIGLDRQIERIAKDKGLATSSLDNTEGLLQVLAGDPLEKQVADLRDAVAFGLAGHDTTSDLVNFYFDEEVALAWEFTRAQAFEKAGPEQYDRVTGILEEFEQALLTDRNLLWSRTLADSLAQSPALVAVGALHLPGEDGLLSLLQKQGFAVAPLVHDGE